MKNFLSFISLFVLILKFIFCVQHSTNKVNYISLDTAGNISLFWVLDYDSEIVKFEVHLPLYEWEWFAIGFSNFGEFYPADYCILSTDWRWHSKLKDFWADEFGNIYMDEDQNCENFNVAFHVHKTTFTFSRKFDTCDENDYILDDGTVHIVWIKGNGRIMDINISEGNDRITHRGMQRTQLLKNPMLYKIKKPRNTQVVDFTANRVQVPNTDTTYWCRVIKIPTYMSQIHHIIEYEALIQRGNEGLVHHMEVFHCEASTYQKISLYNGLCNSPNRPEDTQVCKKVLAAWAMGATPFIYPEEAGLPMGGKNFNKYIMLEVHYNNPELKEGHVDSSGIRIHVTPSLRRYDAGIIELGLEYTDKMAIPPRQDSFPLSGYCISECTAVSIPPQGIIVFGSQLHTHLTGVFVVTRHFRDGRELPELNRDNHYSTHFQEIRLLKQPVRLLPGDALITTCHYNTMNRKNVTLGGFSIQDEMCVNYIHYYPKINLEVCKSSISYQTLFTYFRYLNEWENMNTSSTYGISTNYANIEWDSKRVEDLKNLYADMTLSMQCNISSGYRYPGDWENVPITRVSYTMPPPLRKCKQNNSNW